MGWSSQVVVANQVIIEGTGDGLFLYNGVPGAGTLIGSIAAAAGSDPYGNAFPKGFGVFAGGQIKVIGADGSYAVLDTLGNDPVIGAGTVTELLLQPRNAILEPGRAWTPAQILAEVDEGALVSAPLLRILSPLDKNDNTSVAAALNMYAHTSTQQGGFAFSTDTYDFITATGNISFTAAGGIQVGNTTSAAFVATGAPTATTTSYTAGVTGEGNSRWLVDASGKTGWGPGSATRDTFLYRNAAGTLTVTKALFCEVSGLGETWNAMSLQNSWVNNGAGDSPASFRMVASPPFSVQIVGSIKSGTTAAGSTTIATLPAAYKPTTNQHFPIMCFGVANVAATEGFLDTSGNVKISATAGATRIDFNAILPLDI